MGTREATPRAPSLFGHIRGAVLRLLYGHKDESFHLRQIARSIGSGHGALQRELTQLTELGVVTRKARGNQVLYQANSQSPIFPELSGLVAKTVGVHDVVLSALAPLSDRIEIAFVYGSVAGQRERPSSDIDLMVIGKASFGEVVGALASAQRILGRETNPTVFSVSEFRSRLAAGDHFLKGVMAGKKIFLIGHRYEPAKLAAE